MCSASPLCLFLPMMAPITINVCIDVCMQESGCACRQLCADACLCMQLSLTAQYCPCAQQLSLDVQLGDLSQTTPTTSHLRIRTNNAAGARRTANREQTVPS